MTSTAAQDEFDALFKDDRSKGRHPEDESRRSSDDEQAAPQRETFYEKDDGGEDDDDDDLHDHSSRSASMRSRYFLPSLQSNANTGPKGVIADAQAFEQAKKSRRLSFFGSKDKDPALHSAYPTSKDVYPSEEKNSEDEAEEGFMHRWRQSRLRELQEAGRRVVMRSRTASPSKRVYGNLPTVDADGFLDAVEKVPSDTVVVVFIYDDLSDISTMVEGCVRKLAKKHATTRFVKFHYRDAEIDSAGVPALLAYKGGDKFAGLVPVTEEIPEDQELSPESLEQALKKHQILN